MDYQNAKEKIMSEMNALNSNTCCFTGHRPQNLPWRSNEEDIRCIKMKELLRQEILRAINNGYNVFISGMALGFDIICAEMVLELKKKYKNIKLMGTIPCKTQDKLWKEKDKQRYRKVLSQLDNIRCIYDDYIGPKCMLERNRFMINNSSLVITLFDGKNGGTKKTIDYAKEQNINVIVLKP